MEIAKPTEFERRRISFVCADDEGKIQLFSTIMMVKRGKAENLGAPPYYIASVATAWLNFKQTFDKHTEGFTMIGAVIAVPDGEWTGHVDWVRPTDMAMTNMEVN